MMDAIRVKNSGIVHLKTAGAQNAGMLYAAEAGREIPFAVKRVYFMRGMAENAVRGNHAHRTLTQAIFAAAGSFTLTLDDGATKQAVRIDDPSSGIILGPHLWTTMSEFSGDCVILVFADDYYEESEYIRDYAEFMTLINKKDA